MCAVTRVVVVLVRVESREDTVEVLGVLEVLADDRGGVGVGEHVLPEVLLLGEHMVDHGAEERDVAAGPDRNVQVGEGAGAHEAWVDVNDAGATLLGLHDPLEPDRVRLGEVGTLDDDAVGVLKVLHEGGGATAAEGGAQARDGGAVADPRLVLHLYDAEPGEQLLDQVVLFVVQGRAAEAGDAERACGAQPVLLPFPGAAPRLDHPVGDHVHGRLKVEGLPVGGIRTPVEDLMATRGACGELKGGRSLRAEAASADGRGRIALDLDDFVVLDVDLLATADRAVRTDGRNHPFGRLGARPEPLRVCGDGSPATPQRVGSGQLSVDGPVADPGAHTHHVSSRAAGLLPAVAGVPPGVTCRASCCARSVRRTVRRARDARDGCRSAGRPSARCRPRPYREPSGRAARRRWSESRRLGRPRGPRQR